MRGAFSFIVFTATSMALDLPEKVEKRESNLEVKMKTASKESLFWGVNCFDLYNTKECELLRDKFGFCKFAKENQMEKLCRKTCRLCGQKVDCSKAKYKCCPDGVTPKTDKEGSNCPDCKDKHPELCQKYATDCNDVGWAGQWMHANCWHTCQICKKTTCKDDEQQKEFCPKWKKYGMCDLSGSLMKKYCPQTCGFCGTSPNKTEKPAHLLQNSRGDDKKKV